MRWRCLTHLPGYMLCWQISVLFYYAATFFPFQSKVWLRICRIWVTVAYWKLPAILPLLTFLLLQLGIECHFWLSALPSVWENQRLHVVDGTIIATAIKLAILWESNRAKLLLVKSQKNTASQNHNSKSADSISMKLLRHHGQYYPSQWSQSADLIILALEVSCH